MNGAPISVLLDTSAITAYEAGSIHVGEVMAEVADNGGAVGVPIICLVEAKQSLPTADRLGILVSNPIVALLPNLSDDWEELAEAYGILRRLDAAAPAPAAFDYDGLILSRYPKMYRGVVDGAQVIHIE